MPDSNQNSTPTDAGKPSQRRMTVIVLSIVVLLLMLSLIAQSGFNLRPFVTPDTAAETLLLYALSTLNFLAFVTVLFVLLRNVIKLVRERRGARPGSKFKTRLVSYAIGLSLLPALLLFFFAFGLLNRSIDRWFGEPARQIVDDAKAIEESYFKKEEAELASIARAIARSLSISSRSDYHSAAFEQQLKQEMDEYNLALARVYANDQRITVQSDQKQVEPEIAETLAAAEAYSLTVGDPFTGRDEGDSPLAIYVIAGVRVSDSARDPRLLILAREFPPELTARAANITEQHENFHSLLGKIKRINRLVEDDDRVDAVQGGQQPAAVGLRGERPVRALQRGHADASEFRQTTRQSPSLRAACRVARCPMCSRSKQPPVATTVPPRARTSGDHPATASAVRCPVGASRPAAAQARAVTPPAATYAVAAATAAWTASETSAPGGQGQRRRSRRTGRRRRRCPRSACAAAGTTSGVGPAWHSTAPSAPSVTATAPARQRCRSAWPPRWAVVSASPAPASPVELADLGLVRGGQADAGHRRPGRPGAGPRPPAPWPAPGPSRSARLPGHAAAVVADQDRRGAAQHARAASRGLARRRRRRRRGPGAAAPGRRPAAGSSPGWRRAAAAAYTCDAGGGEQLAEPGPAGVVGERGDQRDVVAVAGGEQRGQAGAARAVGGALLVEHRRRGVRGDPAHAALDVPVEQGVARRRPAAAGS